MECDCISPGSLTLYRTLVEILIQKKGLNRPFIEKHDCHSLQSSSNMNEIYRVSVINLLKYNTSNLLYILTETLRSFFPNNVYIRFGPFDLNIWLIPSNFPIFLGVEDMYLWCTKRVTSTDTSRPIFQKYGSTSGFTSRPVNPSRPVKYGLTCKYTCRPVFLQVDPYYTGRPEFLRVDLLIIQVDPNFDLRVDPYW